MLFFVQGYCNNILIFSYSDPPQSIIYNSILLTQIYCPLVFMVDCKINPNAHLDIGQP